MVEQLLCHNITTFPIEVVNAVSYYYNYQFLRECPFPLSKIHNTTSIQYIKKTKGSLEAFQPNEAKQGISLETEQGASLKAEQGVSLEAK